MGWPFESHTTSNIFTQSCWQYFFLLASIFFEAQALPRPKLDHEVSVAVSRYCPVAPHQEVLSRSDVLFQVDTGLYGAGRASGVRGVSYPCAILFWGI